MNRAERAVARGRAYDLLAHLVRHGPRRWEHLASVALFRPHMTGDRDEVFAEHHRVFGREAPPYASIWFDPAGLLGGDVRDRVGAELAAGGFHPKGEPDHLSLELDFLVFLAGAEADALRDHDEGALRRVLDRQRAFLADHLLRWLPLLRATVARAGAPLYDAAIGMLQDLVVEHATALGATPSPWDLPETDKASTSVTLATPCRSGILWTHTALGEIARAAEIPCGLRSRVEILETLLGEGARFGVLPRVVKGLLAEVDAVAPAVPEVLRPAVGPFLGRLDATRTLLAGLAS